jgi:hypothetical protein
MTLYPLADEVTLRKVVDLELIQTRVTTLAEIPEAIRYLHDRPQVDLYLEWNEEVAENGVSKGA